MGEKDQHNSDVKTAKMTSLCTWLFRYERKDSDGKYARVLLGVDNLI